LIYYLDSSALVKQYLDERGSQHVALLLEEAAALGTIVLTRTEVVAALSKAIRVGVLSETDASEARRNFEADWPDLVRLAASEAVASRAAELAWAHGLRGYDALHLAAARAWADLMDEPTGFATYDRRLWTAARQEELTPWPRDLPAILAAWGGGSEPG
jgi:predicted nucleic acid-binding protein